MQRGGRKVLITGGAGFIGGEIITQCADRYDWVVLDSLSPQIHGADPNRSPLVRKIAGKCHLIQGDVADLAAWEEALEGVEAIIHLAAETGTGQSMYEVGRYARANLQGTANLIEHLTKSKTSVRKVVLASSRSIYGEGMYHCSEHGDFNPPAREVEHLRAGRFEIYCPDCGRAAEPVPTPEDCPPRPASYYAWTKLAQEQMLQLMLPAIKVDYTILRYQNVYGAGQSLNNPYTGILSIFSKLLAENRPINIFEDGLESRDFVHVSDVARITAAAVEPKADNQVVNVGSGRSVSVLRVVETLRQAFAAHSQISITGDFRIGDIRHNMADIRRAEEWFDYRPQVGFDQGIADFAAWAAEEIKAGSRDNGSYERSLEEMRRVGLMQGKESAEV